MFRWLLRVTLLALIAVMILPLASSTPVAAAIRANPAPTEMHVIPAGEKVVRAKYAHAMQSTNLNCDIVELYPGYPGYRGNITGVMPHYDGLGDYECLHILEQDFPLFDQAEEDSLNQQAADALGINGPMHLWTWENWMLIEAERGMLPSCYSCLMLDTATTPIRLNVYPDPDDYRILTGLMGQTKALESIHLAMGSSAGEIRQALDYGYGEDYVLRALAYLEGGHTQNAQELYEEMQYWVQAASSPGGSFNSLGPDEVLQAAIWERGGYTLVPESAAAEDQTTLMGYTFAVSEFLTGNSAILYDFSRLVEEWWVYRLSNPSTPLSIFIQQHPYGQQYGP